MPKHARENEPSPTAVRKAVRDVEEQLSELLSLQGSYMNRCAKVRAKIKDIKDTAVEAGVPKKSLNTVLKRRALRRKLENTILELEKDERAEVSMLEKKLGDLADTPLGKAALKVVSTNGGGKKAEKPKPDPKHDLQEALAATVGETLDDLTKH